MGMGMGTVINLHGLWGFREDLLIDARFSENALNMG